METSLDPSTPVRIWYKKTAYTVDAGDKSAVDHLLRRKARGELPDVVGDFAAVMYLLVEGRPRHDTEIFAHLNGDSLDFTRSNLRPTTRRKHAPAQLPLAWAATARRGAARGVIKNRERFRVCFPAHGVMVSLGYYHSRAVAQQVCDAYRAGTLSLARLHDDEARRGQPLSRRRKTELLRELGLSDPVPRKPA